MTLDVPEGGRPADSGSAWFEPLWPPGRMADGWRIAIILLTTRSAARGRVTPPPKGTSSVCKLSAEDRLPSTWHTERVTQAAFANAARWLRPKPEVAGRRGFALDRVALITTRRARNAQRRGICALAQAL